MPSTFIVMQQTTPSEFAHSRLGLTSWKKFDAIFEAVEAGHRRILVRSANGVGKTTALAALCNWKLSTSDECIVLTTSSSEKQLRHNLWGEIRAQAMKANLYEPKDITDTRIKLGEKRFMLAVSPAKPESAQGFHAASMLIAVDEATGVRRDILSSLIATASSDDVQIVMIYNPITPDSFVYEAERSGDWHLVTISALEHPNVAKKKTKIASAVTLKATEHNLKLWSEEAAPDDGESFELHGKWWRKTLEVCRRILGQWYDDFGEGIISRALVNAAITNTNAERGAKSMGVDLAGGGKDETVIARFDGGIGLPLIVMRSSKILDIVSRIEEEYRSGFTRIAIDETGVIGTASELLAVRDIKVHSVAFSAKAIGTYDSRVRTLGNRRMEMYYHLREELRAEKLQLVDDGKLAEELCTMKLSTKSTNDKYYLEPKENITARLGHSPDRADATALARYANLLAEYDAKPL
ncbi:MAG TPA: hypothetical protein VET48_10995, partial [Steroidobacteraceae bacterium]|nr:hypothetical protein [Steroidobacteraceae bacterium]